MTDRFPSARKPENISDRFRLRSDARFLNASSTALPAQSSKLLGQTAGTPYTYLKEFVLEKLEVPEWPRSHTQAAADDTASIAPESR